MATKLHQRNTELCGFPVLTPALIDYHVRIGKSEPHALVVTVRPPAAAYMLSKNPDNRPLKSNKIRQFSSHIISGDWELNGETVILSQEGFLNDGQNRLTAIVRTGLEVPMTVFFGASRTSRATVDIGQARTAANFLAMHGQTNPDTCSAISRFLLAYEQSNSTSLKSANSFDQLDCFNRAYGDDMLVDISTIINQEAKFFKAFVRKALIGFCYYQFRNISDGDAYIFFDAVARGENLTRGEPAYAVRQRLMASSRDRDVDCEVLFRGWNAFRENRKLGRIMVIGGELPKLS